jgi:curved DNA-binding protein
VQFHPHARLRCEGRDLHMTLRVAPWEAALGTALPVDLPDSSIKVRIPAGAQSGQQLQCAAGIQHPTGRLLLDIRWCATGGCPEPASCSRPWRVN